MVKIISSQAAYRLTRRAALFLLTPLLLFRSKVRSSERQEPSESWIKITSKASLVHLGSIDSFDTTEGGTQAAQLLLDALENQKMDSARAARQIYTRIIPQENFGGEYTALQWFCEYLLASELAQKQLLSEPLVLEFFNFFAQEDFATLKEYLKRKYKLAELEGEDTIQAEERKAFLEDFILFNNPRRETWEKTSQILKVLKLGKGHRIADIGSGPGYYTFKFAQLVGNEGRIFAIDTVEDHLNYVKGISQKYGFENIELISNQSDTIGLAAKQVDLAFMCSLYHIIYTTSIEEVKDRFVESIKKALKPRGTLVIVDNALVEDAELPYHGPYIAKELIVWQLKYYGFRLVEEYAFIPQRYVLVFKMK
jgi:ubiquinone/menaquinone biosynthesis C-methylase UbiE